MINLSEYTADPLKAFVDTLTREYNNIFIANFERNTIRNVKSTNDILVSLRKEENVEYPIDDFLKQYISERAYEEDREDLLKFFTYKDIIKQLHEKETLSHKFRIVSNGEIHHILCNISRIEGTKEALCSIRNVDDIVKDLRDAVTAAENANKAKTVFLNNMSHDIRTPMNSIVGLTALASVHLDDRIKVADYLKKIQASSNHLLSLINEILDMSRIESGKVEVSVQENSLTELMNDVKNIVLTDAKKNKLDVFFDTSNIINDYVLCDKLHINQVLINCLSNSIKFTPARGTIAVKISQLASEKEGEALYEIKVKDTGIGMSKKFLAEVFEPFTRERSTAVSNIQGTGLGMTITKKLVDLMGGEIAIESEEGHGTEITITLPMQIVENAQPKKPAIIEQLIDDEQSEDDAEMDNPLLGKSILLVEDNETNREIAEVLLSEIGAMVESVYDGEQAVERMKEVEPGRYDMILMDIQMPVMNGYEAAKAIRSMPNPNIANIPIIALTANALEEDMKRTKEAGMNAHLSKPLDIGIMVQTLGTEFEKESYRKMAFHDSLTGLYNRHYLAQWQEIHAANPIYPVSFVSVDANDLKKVNDNFSHNAGDLLLKTVGDSLSEVFPQDKSIVARTGGDEFLVLCKGCDHETVLGFVEKARKMARDKVINGVPVTFCVGVVTKTEEFDFDDALHQSDALMIVEKDKYHGRR